VAHKALHQTQGLTGVLSAPLKDAMGVAQGVVICERIPMLADASQPGSGATEPSGGFTECDRVWLQGMLARVGPVLLMRHSLEQPWYLRSWSHLGRLFARLSDPKERVLRGLVLAFFGVSAFLFGWPLAYTVDVPARLVARSETALVSLSNATLMASDIHVGDLVRAGQPMARLVPQVPAAASGVLADQADTDRAAQVLVAPYDGVVIRQGVGAQPGAQLKRGDALWVVAPGLDWRVMLRVDEHDIGRLQPGQRATMRLPGAHERVIHLVLQKPVPLAVDGAQKLQFELEADVTGGSMAGLRPGMQGVVAVEMPAKPMLRRAMDAMRRWWWLTWWGLW
jgi:biotin carboxyl carrier protein